MKGCALSRKIAVQHSNDTEFDHHVAFSPIGIIIIMSLSIFSHVHVHLQVIVMTSVKALIYLTKHLLKTNMDASHQLWTFVECTSTSL